MTDDPSCASRQEKDQNLSRVDEGQPQARPPAGSTAASNEAAPTCSACDGKGYVSPHDAERGVRHNGALFNAGYVQGWEAACDQLRMILGRHKWDWHREEILACVDAVHEREP